jgi:hypothetical protein
MAKLTFTVSVKNVSKPFLIAGLYNIYHYPAKAPAIKNGFDTFFTETVKVSFAIVTSDMPSPATSPRDLGRSQIYPGAAGRRV